MIMMAGVRDPRGLLPITSLDLAKRADLESTHLGHPKRDLLTTVAAVSCGFRLLAGGYVYVR